MAIKVKRELFEQNGKEYYSYFISGKVRGRDVKAGLKPPDNGGYTVLDIIFGDADEAEIAVTPYEMKAEDGRIITGNIYAVESVDEETGEVYSCKVKPARDSDKTLLAMLLR